MKNLKKIFVENNIFFFLCLFIFVAGCYFRLDLFFFANGFHVDEARLAFNILDRNYFELFKPLGSGQVAPYIFLVLSKFLYSVIYPIHPTLKFSDLVFRIIPLISGIISISVFGYLLHKLFKNNLLTLAGMLILAINPVHIVYSTIYKQYTFEALITICILILFLKVDFENKSLKYNLTIFLLLGLSLFCSMTAVYVLPGGFIYLLLNLKNKTHFKKILICTSIFTLIFGIYVIAFLIPVYNQHYELMNVFWNRTSSIADGPYHFISEYVHSMFRTQYYMGLFSGIFVVGLILMLFKNFKYFCFILVPVLVTFFFIRFAYYPFAARLLIFTLPCMIIFFIYPIVFINSTNKLQRTVIYILFIFTIYLGYINVQKKEFINSFPVQTRIVWEYFLKNYKNDGEVIMHPRDPAIEFYNKLGNDIKIKRNLKSDEIKKLDTNTYYVISTDYNDKTKNKLDALLNNSYVLDYKIFEGRDVYDFHHSKERIPHRHFQDGVYMKIRKIK